MMAATEERYISLLTDFGFKRIFGTAPNKDLLINFLNSLFDGKQVIKNIMHLNSEHLGSSRAREFHPHPLTEPCVKVSPHTALHTQRFVHRHNLGV